MQSSRVEDWMSTPALTVEPTATLSAAQRLMTGHGVRRLPVVDDGRLVGIVSQGDLREAQPSMATTLSVFEWRALLDKVPVSECMTADPICVRPDEPVQHAAQLMLTARVSGLPVVAGDSVVGVITESDLFRLLIADLSGHLDADSTWSKVFCPQCGSVVRWRADRSAGPPLRCWQCQRELQFDWRRPASARAGR